MQMERKLQADMCINKTVNFSTTLGRNPHLLLENAKFCAGIPRNQHTVYS